MIIAVGVAVAGLVIALTIVFTTPGYRSVNPPPHPSTGTSSPATRGPALKLTVKVIKYGDGLPLPGTQVKLLQTGTLSSVVTGTLNPALEFTSNVPAGQYQVCIQPPIGWGSKVRTTHVLAGWICSPADLRTSPQLVTFRLTAQVPQTGQ